MKIYSVSFMMTENDNGCCYSFKTEQEAIECRKWLIEGGAYHVSRIW